MLARQVAPSAAQRKAGDTGRGNLSPGDGQAEGLGLVVEPLPR